VDNFSSPDQVFDATLAEKMATATRRHGSSKEFAAMKNLVFSVIQKYADYGHNKCEWSWPLPTSEAMRGEVIKELESRNFTVTPTEQRLVRMPQRGMVPAREGIVISW
jgi:hypothetical protein